MFRREGMRQHVLLLQQPVTNFQCSIYNGSWTATCIHAVYTHHINCNPHQARCWSRRRGHRRHVHLNPQESRENRPTVREAVAHCVMHCTLFLVCPNHSDMMSSERKVASRRSSAPPTPAAAHEPCIGSRAGSVGHILKPYRNSPIVVSRHKTVLGLKMKSGGPLLPTRGACLVTSLNVEHLAELSDPSARPMTSSLAST